MKTSRFARPTVTAIAAAAICLTGVGFTGVSVGLGASGAFAAESTPNGVVIAHNPNAQELAQTPSAQPQVVKLAATPTKPGEITVTTGPGARVTLSAKGVKKVTRANSQGSARFTKLTPGKLYNVAALGQSTRVNALAKVAPVTDLTVRSTNTADSVEINWEHTETKATGGKKINYTVTAEPGNTTVDTSSTDAVLTGLNPDVLYNFTVTPHNAMGPGNGTTAKMNMTLRSLMQVTPTPKTPTQETPRVTVTPAANPTPAPTPNPNPAPAPAPKPGTKTIYVCPSGYAEVGSACTKTLPYTYTYTPYTYRTETTNLSYTYRTETTNLPYTYHTETTGPMPILDSFETQNVCPSGYNLEDYGPNGKWCRLYGPAPTAQVKDAAPAGFTDIASNNTKRDQVKNAPPAGFTDNGSNYTKSEQVKNTAPTGYYDDGRQWVKKNEAPSGYTDNGAEYVATAAKEAKVVPA
jgi:hypothetical protein